MLLLSSQINRTPVMSLQTGSKLGEISGAIIDPRKLQVVAYYVQGSRILTPSVVHTADIREYGPLGFIVDSTDDIMELSEDLVRLEEVMALNFALIGKNVRDDLKNKLGKVVDYTLESEGYTVQKLHVSQSVMKNITSSNLVIHRSQIIEITDREIIVRSATIPKSVSLSQILNPFSKTSPAGTANK